MFYGYKSDDGEVIDVEMSMSEPHPTVITRNGKKYHRYWGSMNVIYGQSFHNEGQIKFKRGPIEGDYEYT